MSGVRALSAALIWLAVLLPLLPLLVWSFADRWFFPALWPQPWSLDAWRYLISPSSRVAEALWTSTLLAMTVVAFSVLIGLPAARALAFYQFRGRELVEWLLLLPILAPMLVVVMGIHILFIRYNLADHFWGVALVHLIPALPYFVLVMASVFANFDRRVEEMARTLGASPLRVWLYATLPSIFPGLAVACMFSFLVSWTQYITTVLIGGGQIITLPMVLFPLIGAANHANAAAVSLIFMMPALLILAVTTRLLGKDVRVLGGFGKL